MSVTVWLSLIFTNVLPFASVVAVNNTGPLDRSKTFSVVPSKVYPPTTLVASCAWAGLTTTCSGSSNPSRVAYLCLKLYGTASVTLATFVDKGVSLIDLDDPLGNVSANKYV